MPIRSRKSRILATSGSFFEPMIWTPSTSGEEAVQPQSERYSVTAVWNSSSRGPCGISR